MAVGGAVGTGVVPAGAVALGGGTVFVGGACVPPPLVGGAAVGATVAVPGKVLPGVGEGSARPSPPSPLGSGSTLSSDIMKLFQIAVGNVPPATGSPWNSVSIGLNSSG